MKKIIIINFIVFSIIQVLSAPLSASAGGSRAAFTRGGWAGARYAGMGMAAEVLVDDVYAIYWNPAGISELRGKKGLDIKEIKEKARLGDADKISEEDLLKFSEESDRQSFVHVGMSGAMLDIERNSTFFGVAFGVLKGVMGIGVYTTFSIGIEGRDESGNKTRDYNYIGMASLFSYGWSFGVSSIGATIKILYESIADVNYMGIGTDIGTQIYILPFLKVGFVIQDLGTGLYPVENYEGIKKEYDLAYPTLKLGISLSTDAGISVALSGVKKMEQDGYGFCLGIEYEIVKYFAIRIGMNNDSFTCGTTIEYANFSLSYAFLLDRIDYGYNNILSLMLMF